MAGSVVYNPELEYEAPRPVTYGNGATGLVAQPTAPIVGHDPRPGSYPEYRQAAAAEPMIHSGSALLQHMTGMPTQQPNGQVVYETVNLPYGNGSPVMQAYADGLTGRRPVTMADVMSIGSLLQGRTGWTGGIDAVTASMQDADKMNAYSAQGAVADDVQRMMAEGYGVDEARMAALTDHLLGQGNSRAAMAVTMPEYAKLADERAKAVMDATIAAGGDYRAKGQFGYTPMHIQEISPSAQRVVVDGQVIEGVAPEHLLGTAYGAIAGGGAGTKTAGNLYTSGLKNDFAMQKGLIDNNLQTEAMRYGYDTKGRSGSSSKSSNGVEYLQEQRKNAEYVAAEKQRRLEDYHIGRGLGYRDANGKFHWNSQGGQAGNKSGTSTKDVTPL